MPGNYTRLSDDEREEISRGIASSEAFSSIAKRLGRSTSTISREVNNHGGVQKYRAAQAANQSRRFVSSRRAGFSKLKKSEQLETYVLKHLKKQWSPNQIARSLEMKYPKDTSMRVSPETIYQYIYVLPRGSLKKTLIEALRQRHKYRRKQKNRGDDNSQETRGKIADMLSIEERPKEVEDRTVPGHWEGDLIIGKYKRSAIGTLVERTTRFTFIVPLKEGKDMVSVRKAYEKTIKRLPRELRKSLTYDQGKEMAQHKQFTIATGMKVYFAHPASPWERGTNENTNGLIRQYFPKGTDFTQVTPQQLKFVERRLNGRPRKSINYQTPQEAMNDLLR